MPDAQLLLILRRAVAHPDGIVRITAKHRHWTKNVERLCGTELAPLGESGSTVQLEILATAAVALLIEMPCADCGRTQFFEEVDLLAFQHALIADVFIGNDVEFRIVELGNVADLLIDLDVKAGLFFAEIFQMVLPAIALLPLSLIWFGLGSASLISC